MLCGTKLRGWAAAAATDAAVLASSVAHPVATPRVVADEAEVDAGGVAGDEGKVDALASARAVRGARPRRQAGPEGRGCPRRAPDGNHEVVSVVGPDYDSLGVGAAAVDLYGQAAEHDRHRVEGHGGREDVHARALRRLARARGRSHHARGLMVLAAFRDHALRRGKARGPSRRTTGRKRVRPGSRMARTLTWGWYMPSGDDRCAPQCM